MRDKEEVKKELEFVRNKISYSKSILESKREDIKLFFKNKYEKEIGDLYVSFESNNLRIGPAHEIGSYCLYVYSMDDNDVMYHVSIKPRIYTEESKKECTNVSNFFIRLLNSKEFTGEFITLNKEYCNLKESYNLEELSSKAVSLEREIERINNKDIAKEIPEIQYFKVNSSFRIKDKVTKELKRWTGGCSRISSGCIFKIESVSKRKINFDVSVINTRTKESTRYTKIHAKFITYHLERGYLKSLTKEEVLEMSMDLF